MVSSSELVWLYLPKGIDINLYDIVKVENIDLDNEETFPFLWEVHFYLEEKNIKPKIEWIDDLESKWFYEEKIIKDFNVRDKLWFFHIKRRKWYSKTKNEIISNDLDIVEKETKTPRDLLFFLKDYLKQVK